MAESRYKNKSGLFEAATGVLMSQCQYLPVPHSAYYSCYQLLKHIWLYTLNKTEEELQAQISLNGAKASHEYLINQIIPLVTDPHDRRAQRDFSNKLIQLKLLRTQADYSDISVDRVFAENAIDLMKDLLRVLKKSA